MSDTTKAAATGIVAGKVVNKVASALFGFGLGLGKTVVSAVVEEGSKAYDKGKEAVVGAYDNLSKEDNNV